MISGGGLTSRSGAVNGAGFSSRNGTINRSGAVNGAGFSSRSGTINRSGALTEPASAPVAERLARELHVS